MERNTTHVTSSAAASPPPDLARGIAAVALLATGGIHLQQYVVAHYSVIPTIGTLFLLNFIGGTVLGLALLVPAPGRPARWRVLLDTAVALAGIGLAAGASPPSS